MTETSSTQLVRFDPRALENCLSALPALGRPLWLPGIINTEGAPIVRLDALAAARQRLLEGGPVIDDTGQWPEADTAIPFAAVCEELGLSLVARGNPDLADQVLRSLLWHLDRVTLLAAQSSRAVAIAHCAQAFREDWIEQVESFKEVLKVFDSLDGVSNFARWSEMRGVLRSQAWQQVLAARERIESMPQLRELIRRVGRRRDSEYEVLEQSSRASVDALLPGWAERTREVELPGAPLETEGIRRSGEFTRMLASEAMLLRGRRRLLAARIAEQTLLSYEHRQFSSATTWVKVPSTARVPEPARRKQLEAGPMILCVDTSASMNGAPEQIAKAVVLEAMRTAAAESRPCLLYAFSGPGDVCEFRLAQDLDGLALVAEFLASSFHGGTDLCDPLERTLVALESQNWAQADLLIASDGQFGLPAALLERFEQSRQRLGLRVQGVLIGDRETIGMRKLCDDVFWVRDWRRYGQHGQVEPPIHASDLTKRYFPAAFRRNDDEVGNP